MDDPVDPFGQRQVVRVGQAHVRLADVTAQGFDPRVANAAAPGQADQVIALGQLVDQGIAQYTGSAGKENGQPRLSRHGLALLAR
ncbi:hypothetical protein D3C81_2029710 [compost metagenome]